MPINKITHVCLTHDKVRARNEKMLEDAMKRYSPGPGKSKSCQSEE